MVKFLMHGRMIPGDLLQFVTSLNSWYVLCTVLSVTLSQAVELSSSIVLWVKNSLMALLTTSTAELGIRHIKGPYGLGKML